jgi:threonine dehydrogenase-like Zn-dependent dehydrogenase
MPTPQPGPADVLIRVNSCALCGSDKSDGPSLARPTFVWDVYPWP